MALWKLYTGDDFPQDKVLVEESMYETIYRLEEAHLGLRKLTKTEARKALAWIKSRIDYRRDGILGITDYDRRESSGYRKPETGKWVTVYLKSFTGENGIHFPHALACHAVHMADLSPGLARDVSNWFVGGWRKPERRQSLLRSGMYCCPCCNSSFQRALFRCDRKLYREQEPAFMAKLKELRERGGGTRWYRAPFYYTILALHEIGTKAAKAELQLLAERAGQRLANKHRGDDRASRARAKIVEMLDSYR